MCKPANILPSTKTVNRREKGFWCTKFDYHWVPRENYQDTIIIYCCWLTPVYVTSSLQSTLNNIHSWSIVTKGQTKRKKKKACRYLIRGCARACIYIYIKPTYVSTYQEHLYCRWRIRWTLQIRWILQIQNSEDKKQKMFVVSVPTIIAIWNNNVNKLFLSPVVVASSGLSDPLLITSLLTVQQQMDVSAQQLVRFLVQVLGSRLNLAIKRAIVGVVRNKAYSISYHQFHI